MIEFIAGLLLGSMFSGGIEPEDPYKAICRSRQCIYANKNAPLCPWHHPGGKYYVKEKLEKESDDR